MNDSEIERAYRLDWKGPFILSGSPGNILFESPEVNKPGIYLFTVEYRNGYLIYSVGVTGQTFRQRFRQHLRAYRNGEYTILNTEYFPRGERKEIFHGISWTPQIERAAQREKFDLNREKYSADIESLLSTFRIFIAPLDVQKRILERIEASITNMLYDGEEPFKSFPDRNMFRAPKWLSEPWIAVDSFTPPGVRLHGLPARFEA